jgi:hypothetical protein
MLVNELSSSRHELLTQLFAERRITHKKLGFISLESMGKPVSITR